MLTLSVSTLFFALSLSLSLQFHPPDGLSTSSLVAPYLFHLRNDNDDDNADAEWKTVRSVLFDVLVHWQTFDWLIVCVCVCGLSMFNGLYVWTFVPLVRRNVRDCRNEQSQLVVGRKRTGFHVIGFAGWLAGRFPTAQDGEIYANASATMPGVNGYCYIVYVWQASTSTLKPEADTPKISSSARTR